MEGLRPCPYCGGEVEVVRLKDDKEGKEQYRIQCIQCKMATAKGYKFEKESKEDGLERIMQYKMIMDRIWRHPEKFNQSEAAKKRDRQAAKPFMF